MSDLVYAVRNRGDYYYAGEIGEPLPETGSFEQCDGCGGPADPETGEPTFYVLRAVGLGRTGKIYLCTCGSEYAVTRQPADDVIGVPS